MISISPPALSASRSDYEASRSGMRAEPLTLRWAYAFAYPSSAHRTRALAGRLRWYNRRRPHGSLGGLPPVSRVLHLCGQYS